MVARLKKYARPLVTGILIATVLLALWAAGFFSQIQLGLTNVYYVSAPTSGNIVIVALDDASFAKYGRSPTQWSRDVYRELVERVSGAGARVIAFDLIFSEASPSDKNFATAMKTARDSDYRTRFVLASAGVNIPTAIDTSLGYPYGLRYDTAIIPTENLNEALDYYGYVNAFPDSDSRLRRQPTLFQIQDQLELSFSVATYLAYLRIPSVAKQQVVTYQDGMLAITPERHLDVDANGFWRQNFFGAPTTATHQTFPVVSMRDVLTDVTDMSLFKDKIVLVGIANSTGVTDQYLVPPSSQPMAGVEIQANAIETLIQNNALTEQGRLSQVLIIAFLTIASTLIYYEVGWKRKLVLATVFVVAWLLFAFLQFSLEQEVYNLLYPSLALILPLVITIGFNISDEVTLRIRTEAEKDYLSQLNAKTEAEKHLLEILNAKTEAEKQTLEDLNQLKTRMIRMASHDLKNPLGRVFGYAELVLMDDNITEENRKFVEHIKESGEEMNTLITEILNLEQLRSGVLMKEDLAFNQLVREVVSRHEPDFYRKSQTFVDEITDDAVLIHADTRQVSQAISNLVGNAVKYTPEKGTITVKLVLKEGVAHLEVIDNGYGMPEHAIPKLFTEFYRVRTEATAGIAGTGLGLSLVKSVVDAHHGKIWVESAEGKGSTFFVDMPIAPQSS